MQIGIVGCGHLGLALARTLIAHGFSPERLRISFGGNPDTLVSIKEARLERSIATNTDILALSDVVFITLRPDGVQVLRGFQTKTPCLIVSCVAGVSCAALQDILGRAVIRLMPSSPQSIEAKSGIAALYPSNQVIKDLLCELDLETAVLDNEKQLHLFTALVCLPAAYLQMEVSGRSRTNPDLRSFSDYGFDEASRVMAWAEENTPSGLTDDEAAAYISRMATRGGITEAIVAGIKDGSDIHTALLKGIERGETIAGER